MNPVMFNAEFYLAQNEDVAAAVAAGDFPDAFAHFQEFGQFELRQPNAFFDPIFYLSNNPDVLRAVATGQIESAFSHFIEFGQFEGGVRAPSADLVGFDEAAYLAANEDVAAAVAAGDFPNAFAHFLQFGVNENRPASPNFVAPEPEPEPVDPRVAALEDFQEAVSARDAFLEENETTAEDIATNLTFAQNELDAARAEASDARLQANLVIAEDNLARANAAIAAADADQAEDRPEGVPTIREAVDGIEAANAAVETAQTAATQSETVRLGEVARFNAVNDVVLQFDEVGSAFIVEEDEEGNPVNTPVFTVSEDGTVVAAEGAEFAGLDALVAATQASSDAAEALSVAQADAEEFQAVLDANEGVVEDFNLATGQVEAAELALEGRAELVGNLADAQADVDALASLDADVAAALAALEELDVDAVNLVDGIDDVGTDGNDLFVFADQSGTIEGFGVDGTDELFIGTDFTETRLASDVDLGATAQGNVAALEVFIQQNGDNTVLFFENETFSGSARNGFDGQTVTLVGINAEDVTIDANGFLRVTEADALFA